MKKERDISKHQSLYTEVFGMYKTKSVKWGLISVLFVFSIAIGVSLLMGTTAYEPEATPETTSVTTTPSTTTWETTWPTTDTTWTWETSTWITYPSPPMMDYTLYIIIILVILFVFGWVILY